MDASAIQDLDVVYYAAVSLDGYIADNEGNVSWLDGYFIPELGFHDFLVRIKGTIMGRATYDKIVSFGKWPYEGVPGTIVTNRPVDTDFGPVHAASGSAAETLKQARDTGPGPYWLVGGADLATQFLTARLLTRIDLFVIPVLLGGGIAAFRNEDKVSLSLIDSQTYPKGIVRLSYKPL